MFERIKAHIVHNAPVLLRLPLKTVPFSVKKRVIEQLVNWQFSQALADGELDFLAQRWLKIEVRDLSLSWFISFDQQRLLIQEFAEPDVTFSANANDLILVAARKEDPDTLFFQRRLLIEGDTELGLYVKNLMDSIELETMPIPLRLGLLQLANLVEAGLKEGAAREERVSYHVNQN